jgi:hypothetical protein
MVGMVVGSPPGAETIVSAAPDRIAEDAIRIDSKPEPLQPHVARAVGGVVMVHGVVRMIDLDQLHIAALGVGAVARDLEDLIRRRVRAAGPAVRIGGGVRCVAAAAATAGVQWAGDGVREHCGLMGIWCQRWALALLEGRRLWCYPGMERRCMKVYCWLGDGGDVGTWKGSGQESAWTNLLVIGNSVARNEPLTEQRKGKDDRCAAM